MAVVGRKIDSLLALGSFLLILFGLVMIYSASVVVGLVQFGDPKHFFVKQLISFVVGAVALVWSVNFTYHNWEKLAKWMLPAILLLLLSVFVLSKGDINGAQRWINIGSQGVQPSEIAKFALIVYFSAWFSTRKDKVGSLTETLLPFLGIMGVIGFLMLKEPDFGTYTVMCAAAGAIYFVAGINWKQVGVLVLVSVIALAAILSVPYRRARVEAFLNPQTTEESSANQDDATYYHVKNISIAIGSGGWFGAGFGNSKQKRLFLPEPHNDSIFAVIVEELGFLVATLFLSLLGFVIYRCYLVALRAPDLFGRLMATGIASWFAYQAFLNLAAMLQLLPLKGVPIPFVSYGGTNLVISMFALGVLLNISRFGEDSKGKNTFSADGPKRKRKLKFFSQPAN